MNFIEFISAFKRLALGIVLVSALVRCADEEKIVEHSDPYTEAAQVSKSTEVTASSFTVSGIHTIVNNEVDCSTCTYYVQPSAKIVDGSELELKPGAVICLNKAIAYQQLEFVNLIGTEENPIVITSCGE